MSVTSVAYESDSHKVLIYALSVCLPCKEAAHFLSEAEVDFEYIEVDGCDEDDRRKILNNIRRRGGNLSISHILYPKIIIDDTIMITGFDKQKISEILLSENT